MASQLAKRHAATWLATLETGEQPARKIADLIAESCDGNDVAVTLVDIGGGNWRVAIHCRAAPDRQRLRGLTAAAAGRSAGRVLRFARVAAMDWVGASLAGLKPVAAGRFVVHGAHDRGRIPPYRIAIEIEAALAFGTGHHGTTRGCLVALDGICKTLHRQRPQTFPSPGKGEGRGGGRWLGGQTHTSTRLACARRPPHFRGRTLRILDLGTGSGVLAIAAAKALGRRVLATDVDANAVRIARDNARLNHVGPLLEVVRADGVASRRVQRGAPYDLIFANILLQPLRRFAVPLGRLAAPGAHVVLSGLLASHANAIVAAYRALTLERRIDIEGWTTLVFRRPSRTRPVIAGRRGRS